MLIFEADTKLKEGKDIIFVSVKRRDKVRAEQNYPNDATCAVS